MELVWAWAVLIFVVLAISYSFIIVILEGLRGVIKKEMTLLSPFGKAGTLLETKRVSGRKCVIFGIINLVSAGIGLIFIWSIWLEMLGVWD